MIRRLTWYQLTGQPTPDWFSGLNAVFAVYLLAMLWFGYKIVAGGREMQAAEHRSRAACEARGGTFALTLSGVLCLDPKVVK